MDETITLATADAIEDLRQRPSRTASDRRLTHCDIVRTTIEEDIFMGRRLPGAPLDEDAIARDFSVSRTPVREAMLQLIQTGLVEKEARKRPIVARLNLKRLIQMFETLSEFEGLCARLAARRITPPEREQLVEYQQAGEQALRNGEENEYLWVSRRFHAQIWAATHNEILIDATRKLSIRLIPYRMFQVRYEGRREANNDDHAAMLAAIVAGDADKAQNLMRGHVTVQGDVLADYISTIGHDHVE